MERKVPNRWTEEEDSILQNETQKQAAKGTIKDWNRIAAKLPGRTNKDCRKRWVNKVCGSLKKGMWDYAEDQRLIAAVEKHGQKWTLVANEVAFRSPDQCAKRWQSKLDPILKHSSWTAEEDALLMKLVDENGRGWKMMQEQYFPERSANELKNRHTVLSRQAKVPYARSGSLDSCSVSVAGTEDAAYTSEIYNGPEEDAFEGEEDYRGYWNHHRGSWSSMVDSSSICTTPYSPILPHDVSATPLNEYISSTHLAISMGEMVSQPGYNDMTIGAYSSETPLSTSASGWSDQMGSQGFNTLMTTEDPMFMASSSPSAAHTPEIFWSGDNQGDSSHSGSEILEDEPVGKVSLLIDGCDRDTLHHLIELTRSLKGKSKIEINNGVIL
ncbi:Homeodomain-like protein [Xylariaceae sp. FL0255]|nr:Homeodomain-like protein [Xylariaceae sp. FL0255]